MEENDLMKQCNDWANRENEVSTIEALTLLTEYYMEQCGLSLTMRTLAYDAGEFWLSKLSNSNHPLAEYAKTASVTQIMPELSEEFKKNKEKLWRYDIDPFLDIDYVEDGILDIIEDDSLSDKFKIAFARGIIPYYNYIVTK